MPSRSLTCGWLICLLICPAASLAQEPTWRDEDRAKWLERHATVEKKLLVPMRDGVGLSTDLYLPKDREGPFPTIFWRTPYNYNELNGGRLRLAQPRTDGGARRDAGGRAERH